MKLLFSATVLLTTGAASAACPSIDKTIALYNKGNATGSDVAKAASCQIENSSLNQTLCSTRIGLLKDIVRSVKAEFNVGEATSADIAQAQQDLARAMSSCPE